MAVLTPQPPPGHGTASAAASYWDSNRKKSLDPTYWMAHPACRRAINRRVSGDPEEWPLDWFKRRHWTAPFRRAVSWGCGLGRFERSAMRLELAAAIDAFDISEASLADARLESEREGMPEIHYAVGSFDDPVIPRNVYDAAFFHASLHHVAQLGRLFRRMALALRPRATVYVDEYVGPSRTHWTSERLALAQSVLDGAPPEAKLGDRVAAPIEIDDPSEAIRSDEIPHFLREFLDIVEWRPFGGQVAGLLFPYLDPAWLETPAGCAFVESMLAIEDAELDRDPAATHHLVAIGRLKPRSACLVSIARQVQRELKRRLRQLPATRAN